MPAESYDDDEDEIEGPKSSFGTYLAEGDALFKQSEFKKALESYSLALELEPEDKNCLVARSKCYLKLGDPQKALEDAEAALSEDKEFNKGLYRKAEALYCMGDFEYALMYYHRGHHLRPELDEFRLGIQKAQEAIDNSIGGAAKVKLENKGDLSFFNRQDDSGSKKRGYNKPTRNLKLKPVIVNRNKESKPPAPSKKTVKQLLGELYADKEYMEKLMTDDDFIKSHSNKPVYELVQSGLTYLDTRTEFWRQQRPLYARKKDTGKSSPKKKKATQSLGKQILKQLEDVDQALASGDAERSLKLAQALMKTVDHADPVQLPNKADVLANIHSCIGNAFVEMENLNKALKHHQKDLEMSKKSNSKEGISRGLDNVGRVYARMGNFERAVRSWNEKLPMVKTPLETTWIYHEIGRCYLELEKYSKAKDCGVKSLDAAQDFEDEVWQLNASVLVAQALVKLGDLEDGLDKFEKAHELAVSLSDEAAQDAINKAISDLKRKIADGGTTSASGQPTTTDTDRDEDNESETNDDDDDKDAADADKDHKDIADSETEDDTTPRATHKDSDIDPPTSDDDGDDDKTKSDSASKTTASEDKSSDQVKKDDVDESTKDTTTEDKDDKTEDDATDQYEDDYESLDEDEADENSKRDDPATASDLSPRDTTTDEETEKTTTEDETEISKKDDAKIKKSDSIDISTTVSDDTTTLAKEGIKTDETSKNDDEDATRSVSDSIADLSEDAPTTTTTTTTAAVATTTKDADAQLDGDKDNADDNTLDDITPRNSDDEDDKTAENLQKPDTTKEEDEKDQTTPEDKKDEDKTKDSPTPDDKEGESTPIENKEEEDKDDSEFKASDVDRVEDVSPSSTTEKKDETLLAESDEIVNKDPEVPSDNDKDLPEDKDDNKVDNNSSEKEKYIDGKDNEEEKKNVADGVKTDEAVSSETLATTSVANKEKDDKEAIKDDDQDKNSQESVITKEETDKANGKDDAISNVNDKDNKKTDDDDVTNTASLPVTTDGASDDKPADLEANDKK